MQEELNQFQQNDVGNLVSKLEEKSIWQGDPLSLYLFVLCMEKLTLSIQSRVDMGDQKLVHISKNGLDLLLMMSCSFVRRPYRK